MDTLKRLFPYLWASKWRVMAALTFMVGAKVANVSVPLLLKDLVDAMSFKPGDVQTVLVVPMALLLLCDDGRWITGQAIGVDGGFNAGHAVDF